MLEKNASWDCGVRAERGGNASMGATEWPLLQRSSLSVR